jgi:hypothetical protein
MRCARRVVAGVLCFGGALASPAEVRVTHERIAPEAAEAAFEPKTIPRPALNDAAAEATFRVLQGNPDPNGGEVAVLRDGRVPDDEDAPRRNFFFRAGSGGGRLLVDLHEVRSVARVSSYSWHGGERGPQVYDLYGASGSAAGFRLEAGDSPDPTTVGWTRLGLGGHPPAGGREPRRPVRSERHGRGSGLRPGPGSGICSS